MRLLRWALLNALLLATSVAAQDVAPSNEFFPTAIGTQWVYRSGVIEIIERIAAHERVGNDVCVKLETTMNGKVIANEHYAVRPDGVYRVAVANQLVEPPLRLLKFPLALNETWTVNSIVLKQPIKGTFQTTQAKVKVPAGEYQTVTSVGTGFNVKMVVPGEAEKEIEQPLVFSYSFAKGIGKVQQTTTIGTGPGAKKIELSLKEFIPVQ